MRVRRIRTVAVTAALATIAGLTSVIVQAQPAAASPICTISNPLLAKPARDSQGFFQSADYLEATNGHGLWAGVRSNGSSGFDIFTWRAGHATILDHFDLRVNGGWSMNDVSVVGVSAAGAVTVAVPRIPSNGLLYLRTGYRYSGGHRYQLKASPEWASVQPTSVAPDGRVVGWIRTKAALTSGKKQLVEWSAGGSGSVSVLDRRSLLDDPVIDAAGDIAYGLQNSQHLQLPQVRYPDGRVLHLAPLVEDGLSNNAQVHAAVGTVFYGDAANLDTGGQSLVTWNASDGAARPAGSVLEPVIVPGLEQFGAVGGNGALVSDIRYGTGVRYRRRLRDSTGHLYPMPAQLYIDTTQDPPAAIGPDGTVAYTGLDGNVRFFKCRQNPADRNPRGKLDRVAVTDRTVKLGGWAVGPDRYAGTVLVDVYEMTPHKRMIGRYLAGNPSADVDQALHIAGAHRFAAAFTAAKGTHRYCAYALNVDAGNANPAIGCTTVGVY